MTAEKIKQSAYFKIAVSLQKQAGWEIKIDGDRMTISKTWRGIYERYCMSVSEFYKKYCM